MISKSRVIGGIEIGTAKVSVLIGETTNGRELNLIGFGKVASRGVLKGTVYEYRLANDALQEAVRAAEKMAKATIEGVYLAYTGDHLDGSYNEAKISVSSPDGVVSEKDLERVEANAKAKEVGENRMVVQALRGPYHLDGRQVTQPVDMTGNELAVGVWKVHGDINRISDSIRLLNGINLTVEELILSSIASGQMVTQDEERRSGVLVLDIGSGTTDYALYKDNFVVRAGAIPVGGDHLTNDLSLGLGLSRREAEYVKIEHGKALPTAEDGQRAVVMEGGEGAIGERSLSQLAISQILEARVREIFEILQTTITSELLNKAYIPGGVIITGGTSQLPGVTEVGSQALGLPVRCGQNPKWVVDQLSGPECSTMLGLLYRGFSREKKSGGSEARRAGGLFHKIGDLFGWRNM
ncbi:MAG: cell division protein FtsA [Opitutales bacterium]|nr:cell division protein FtsA [Opitutales bacterium]MCH8539951.1 cell division protein FtsA [Opitutales bacterium]